ncbi:trigger factor family protein, partial [Escherichia coli]|uniref:trigger factor family protein n=1 Tax=Escherichia coli TaxID=562 RepID=UPI002703D683
SRIHLSFGPETYNPRVEKTLKNYRNQANIPGFRKGQAPIGMIKRMYGQSVLYEEVNKLVQESLDNYLKENNIQIFAYPVPA